MAKGRARVGADGLKTIVRLEAHVGRFLIIDKQAAEDARLSLRAVGLHTYLLGKPDDWQVSVEHLASTHTEGRDAVRVAINELRDAGYVAVETVRERGRVIGTRWTVYETPALKPDPEKPSAVETGNGFPASGLSASGFAGSGESATTKEKQGRPRTEETEIPVAAQPVPDVASDGGGVACQRCRRKVEADGVCSSCGLKWLLRPILPLAPGGDVPEGPAWYCLPIKGDTQRARELGCVGWSVILHEDIKGPGVGLLMMRDDSRRVAYVFQGDIGGRLMRLGIWPTAEGLLLCHGRDPELPIASSVLWTPSPTSKEEREGLKTALAKELSAELNTAIGRRSTKLQRQRERLWGRVTTQESERAEKQAVAQ
jgi:biotin operon repressor